MPTRDDYWTEWEARVADLRERVKKLRSDERSHVAQASGLQASAREVVRELLVEEALGAMDPVEALADKLHASECFSDHTDQCGYYYGDPHRDQWKRSAQALLLGRMRSGRPL